MAERRFRAERLAPAIDVVVKFVFCATFVRA
jgi:hypothetical protein